MCTVKSAARGSQPLRLTLPNAVGGHRQLRVLLINEHIVNKFGGNLRWRCRCILPVRANGHTRLAWANQ